MITTYDEVAAFINAHGGSVDSTDTEFQRKVQVADRTMKRLCSRQFENAQYTYLPVVYGGIRLGSFAYGTRTLALRESPIHSIDEVRIDYFYGELAAGTIMDASRFRIMGQDRNEILNLDGFFPDGERTVQVTYTAGYYPIDDADPTHAADLMPADLRDGVGLLTAHLINRGSDDVFRSETLGQKSYTRFGTVDDKRSYDPLIDQVIADYSRY